MLAAGSQLELFHVYDQSAPAFLEYAEFRSAEVRRARTQHASRTHARTQARTRTTGMVDYISRDHSVSTIDPAPPVDP